MGTLCDFALSCQELTELCRCEGEGRGSAAERCLRLSPFKRAFAFLSFFKSHQRAEPGSEDVGLQDLAREVLHEGFWPGSVPAHLASTGALRCHRDRAGAESCGCVRGTGGNRGGNPSLREN